MKAAVTIVVVLGISAGPALAQAPPSMPEEVMRARQELQVMERALEVAVQHGIRAMSESMPTLSPNLVLVGGPIQARGFRLDGYGLFFDLEVPAVRRSIAWSLQTLGPAELNFAAALEEFRRQVEELRDMPTRASLEQALERLETRVIQPVGVGAAGARTPVPPSDDIQPPPAAPARRPVDLVAVYGQELKAAVLDAMLRHSGALPIGDEDWLTVAFRDEPSWFTPADVTELTTITLRVRGSDLRALREGRLSFEDARARVETREF